MFAASVPCWQMIKSLLRCKSAGSNHGLSSFFLALHLLRIYVGFVSLWSRSGCPVSSRVGFFCNDALPQLPTSISIISLKVMLNNKLGGERVQTQAVVQKGGSLAPTQQLILMKTLRPPETPAVPEQPLKLLTVVPLLSVAHWISVALLTWQKIQEKSPERWSVSYRESFESKYELLMKWK